jgi:AAA family ATP:ADP antiporter
VEGKQKIPGNAWSGVNLVFQSPYLRKIALYIFFMTFASTVLYFQQADLVGEAFTDRGVRREFLGSIDMYTNILTVFAQAFLAAHIIGWFGVGLTLAILPGIAALGFLGLRAFPNIEILRVVQVLYRSGRYAVARPAREVLYTVVGREGRYKSKAFIDAAVYRGGDLVNGWVYAGLGLLGLGVASIALISVPIMGLWMAVGLGLGKAQEEKSRVLREREPATEGPAAG